MPVEPSGEFVPLLDPDSASLTPAQKNRKLCNLGKLLRSIAERDAGILSALPAAPAACHEFRDKLAGLRVRAVVSGRPAWAEPPTYCEYLSDLRAGIAALDAAIEEAKSCRSN